MKVRELIHILCRQSPDTTVQITLNGCSHDTLTEEEIEETTFHTEPYPCDEDVVTNQLIINLTKRYKKAIIGMANSIGRE